MQGPTAHLYSRCGGCRVTATSSRSMATLIPPLTLIQGLDSLSRACGFQPDDGDGAGVP